MSEYNYKKFLSDSSDDSPKYTEIPVSDCSHEIIDAVKETSFPIKQIDDDMNYADAYNQPFHYEPATNLIALENVLSLAEERCEFLYGNISEQTGLSADQIIADDSILAVKAMLNLMKAGADFHQADYHSTPKQDANIALAYDQDNK